MKPLGTAAACAALLFAAAAPAAGEEKAVVIVSPENRSLPVVATLDQAIRTTLQARSPAPVRFYREYLDLSGFAGPSPEALIARLIKEKYEGRKIDLVMPCGEAAIRFVLERRAAMLPSAPVVFCSASRDSVQRAALAPDVTGVTMSLDWAAMVELALRLHPGAQRIVFIGGSGPTAREWEDQARRALSALSGRVELQFLTGLSMPDLLRSVSTLPADSIGLFNAFIRDASGRTFTTPEALGMVAGVARFPLYGLSETLLGQGIVGGPMIDFQAQGATAAELGWRVLGGERLGPGDIVDLGANTWLFDARQLQRWSIPEDRLPPGSVVRFRQVSAWRQYRWQIALALALSTLQTLLIVGLLLQRRRRKRAEQRLDERLRFETLLSDLAAGFIRIRADEVDGQIENGLRRVVEELGVDRAAVGELGADGSRLRLTHSWTRPDVSSAPDLLETSAFPWGSGRIRAGQVVAFSRPEDLPGEAAADRAALRALGIRSLALVPFVLEGTAVGVLACSLLHDQRTWPEELVERLRLLAEVFSIVLWRRRAQKALEESEGRFRVMADAAPVMIWLAGPDGGCIDFNRAWLEFTGRTLAQELGDGWAEGVHPEDRERCLEVYQKALAARRPFSMEYRLRSAGGTYRAVLDRGVPRFDGGGFSGYVGSAVDIGEIRAAEEKVEQGREELAHALRVATLGELAATLAHEINQPLTAILSNAHATRHMLDAAHFDRAEFAEALEDIAQDARRAAEIIRRLRALYRKQHSDRRPLDVNEAIREVTGLLKKDLERKRVGLQLELAENLPQVLGDVVQLQQVFLNVVVNACDAMKGSENGPRQLRIETSHRNSVVAIDIRDSGTGVKEPDLGRIFERFVTTKPEGLGMGLSISRSIIDAHGGRIWATRNPDRGLTIHSELPCLPS